MDAKLSLNDLMIIYDAYAEKQVQRDIILADLEKLPKDMQHLRLKYLALLRHLMVHQNVMQALNDIGQSGRFELSIDNEVLKAVISLPEGR